ncbi:hypothetical protein PENFLA_c002G09628 [Penicillium flavigenum]|uniref:Uncharacterized protein n=1 Tax=Penicillium flavigenum TaxID=254877 RepID=A0A1V6TZ86_9EURO|nr:hypothetical protein PENFLA_c002G09628 [Penicillium flavigenum]
MNPPTTPTPRSAHAFAGIVTRSQRVKLVSVIAFHWGNDNLNVVPLETELLSVFRDHYGTSTFTIPVNPVNPNTDPHLALFRHLMNHADESAGPNTLRIYVYSAHSHDPEMRGRSWNLTGTLDPNAPVVNWWIIWPYLESYPGPVCYIFDTCSAVSAVFESYNWGEFLGASGWDTNVPAAHNTSFTRALINTLKDMRGENSPLATVYSRLIHDTRSARIAVFPINVSKPRTESVTIGNQDLPGRLAQAAIRNHIRVLLGVNIDSINDPRALDINFWKQWSPQVPGVQPGSIKVEAIYTGSPFVLFSISIEM